MPWDAGAAATFSGFRDMGAEIVPLSVDEGIPGGTPEDMTVDRVECVRRRLHELGCTVHSASYTESLQSHLGRRVWRSTINAVSGHPESWPVFVKPIEEKRFGGRLVKSGYGLIGCGTCRENPDTFCSEPVSFVAEWRCVGLRGQNLDVRRCRGPGDQLPDPAIVRFSLSAGTNSLSATWKGEAVQQRSPRKRAWNAHTIHKEEMAAPGSSASLPAKSERMASFLEPEPRSAHHGRKRHLEETLRASSSSRRQDRASIA